jgi:hypothetical protein
MEQSKYRNLEAWMLPVMEKYWSGKAWSELIKEFEYLEKPNIPQLRGPHAIGKVLIPEKCVLCQGAVIGHFANRSEFKEGVKWSQWSKCISCGHRPFNSFCDCSGCKRDAEKKASFENARMQEQIGEQVQLINKNARRLEEIHSYHGWAIVLAMLTQSTSEDPFIITPLNDSDAPLAPSQKKTINCIQEIGDCLQFLDPYPKSGLIKNNTFYWNCCSESYKLVGAVLDPKHHLLESLKKCTTGCLDAECIALDIKELMLDEALEFLERTREEYGLPHQVGEITHLLFTKLIIERPLGEILFLIWRSCTDCAALVQKRDISRIQASNQIIGTIERLHVKGRDCEWKFKSYKRFKYIKQNWLSYIYFNLMLQLPGEGLEYSWLDVLKRQQLHLNIHPEGIIAKDEPYAFELLKHSIISKSAINDSSSD